MSLFSQLNRRLRPQRGNPPPALFLHIGLAKTGTTSIQQFCLANHDNLLGHGVLYPRTGLQGPGHQLVSLAFMNSSKRQMTVVEKNTPRRLSSKKLVGRLVREFTRLDGQAHSVLLSSERFAALKGKEITRLKAGLGQFDIRPILYVRRQDYLAESMHAQAYRVRSSFFCRDRILKPKKGSFHFYDLVSKWGQVFGLENMKVRRFQKGRSPDELTQDFMEAMDIRGPFGQEGALQLNTRLGRDALEYIFHHTTLEYGSKEYYKVERKLIDYSKEHPTRTEYRNFFSPRERLQLLEVHAEGNKQLARQFFGTDELFASPPPKPDEPWAKYPGLSARKKKDIEEFVNS